MKPTIELPPSIKRWLYAFGFGLLVGISVGTVTTYWSIVKDCKVMGMFRYGDAPMSCTYHLVKIQDYGQAELPPKEEKKKK